MRAKTIKSILTRKHKELVDSITDPRVKNLVANNTIITGGCIVSMLLGEQVNDFDLYFTDLETVKAVAEYYVNTFNAANRTTVELREDGGRIKIWVQSAGVAAESGTNPFEDLEDEDLASKEPTDEDGAKSKYRPIFLTSNAITLSDRVQLIIRFYGPPDEIHSNYDFAHCTSYYVTDDQSLVLRPAALEAILAKELIYSGSKYPVASLIRTRKFIKRGWRINAGQYVKMALQISELNLRDPNVLEDQLTGVDFAYFTQVIHYLRERQEKEANFEITASYLCEVIDRIF